jgi:cytoskeleton protein RodZ
MADIGTTLREARMRARIDMSEVEAQTKIRAKYLRAIENEEWDLLPGPVYVKSFLRTYGDFLGLDSRMLVEEYKRQYERPSDHELRPASSVSRERERAARGPLLPPWALIGVVLVAIVAALAVVGSIGGKKSPPTPTTQAGGTHHARHRARRPAAPALPASITLQLVPTGTVYVCLVNGAGTVLIPGRIFTTGQTIPSQTAAKLLLTLGNAAVQMKVNGKPVTVTPSATSIGYLLQPSGASPLPVAQQPRCA